MSTGSCAGLGLLVLLFTHLNVTKVPNRVKDTAMVTITIVPFHCAPKVTAAIHRKKQSVLKSNTAKPMSEKKKHNQANVSGRLCMKTTLQMKAKCPNPEFAFLHN